MPPRIDDLTGCRAVFALWVFLYHLNLQLFTADPFGPLTAIMQRGYLGVDAFFILSGLVLAHAHRSQEPSWKTLHSFWLRRLLRIYPIHFAVILLLLLLLAGGSAIGLVPRDPTRFGVEALLQNLLLIHGWGSATTGAWNYPSWSISTEWAGYLAFPIIWAALRRLGTRLAAWGLLILLAILAAVEWAGAGMHLNLPYQAGFGRFIPEFLAGMVLARCATALTAWPHAPWLVWLGLASAALAALTSYDTALVAALFLILAGLLARAGQGRAPLLAAIPGCTFAGTLSYSFYMSFAVIEMLHAVIWRALALTPTEHPFTFALTSFTATLALALLLWRWVERPCRALIHLAARPASL